MDDFTNSRLIVQHLGLIRYERTLLRMNDFTTKRTSATADQIWVLEHHPVYTLGHAADPAHLLDTGNIPVVRSDRGGQVTYHGPGQAVLYVLIDLARRGLGVRTLVTQLEGAVIELLETYGVKGRRRPNAPGVYVAGEKIASLGLRVRKGCSFHGLSLNVDLDLEPFSGIDPCGYEGLRVTRLVDHGMTDDLDVVAGRLVEILCERLHYGNVEHRISASMESRYDEPVVK